ncbi:hypothetical protein T439DRAFT_360124 [Meredithblackwellia eburnea MCA 4105]
MSTVSTDTLTGRPLASQYIATVILGPFVAGWAMQLVLYGAVLSTFFQYVASTGFQRDGTKMRVFLIVCVVLCTCQAVISFISLIHYATSQKRDTDTLYSQTVFDALETLPVGLLGALTQTFLASRAKGLFHTAWKRYVWIVLVGTGIAAGVTGSMLYLVISTYNFEDRQDELLPLTFQSITGLWLWGGAFTDVLISSTLVVLLAKRLKHDHSSTDSLLLYLMRVAIHSASYTALFALVGAILSFSFATSDLASQCAAPFWVMLAPCYCFSILTTLGSREKAQHQASKSAGGITLSILRSEVSSGPEGDSPVHLVSDPGPRGAGSGGVGLTPVSLPMLGRPLKRVEGVDDMTVAVDIEKGFIVRQQRSLSDPRAF